MADNDRHPAAQDLGKQHILLRSALAQLERHLVAGAPAALALLALKNLRYLSAAHERAEHEVLRFHGDYASFESLHRGLGSLWNAFITSLESALDAPSAAIGEDQILLGRQLLSALAEHWREEEQQFTSEFQPEDKSSRGNTAVGTPAI